MLLFSVACPTKTTFSFLLFFFGGGGRGGIFFFLITGAISSVFLISIFTQMSIEIIAFWKE